MGFFQHFDAVRVVAGQPDQVPAADNHFPAFLAQMSKATNLSDADKKATVASVASYGKAKQDLQTAVAALSKDVQMQSYVAKTLSEVYLNQKF